MVDMVEEVRYKKISRSRLFDAGRDRNPKRPFSIVSLRRASLTAPWTDNIFLSLFLDRLVQHNLQLPEFGEILSGNLTFQKYITPKAMGSVVLPHLVTGWHVDQAIMSEEDRLVVIRFGRDWDPDCMRQDEVLYRIAERVKNFAVVYVCDLDQVPDFKQMYELYDPLTIMFFFRNKHMMCDFGTGNNNKLNWVLEDKQELIDIIETIYRGAKKGRGLVVSPKDYSTRYRY